MTRDERLEAAKRVCVAIAALKAIRADDWPCLTFDDFERFGGAIWRGDATSGEARQAEHDKEDADDRSAAGESMETTASAGFNGAAITVVLAPEVTFAAEIQAEVPLMKGTTLATASREATPG